MPPDKAPKMGLPFHHNATQEYLRAWGHAPTFKALPGFIRNEDRSVVPREHISIRRTAGAFGLYGLTNVDPESANAMERDFLTPHVDNPGHVVLKKIRAGNLALTDPERWAFAVFLNSLNVRTPKMVERARAMGVQTLKDELARDTERYEELWKPGYPETAEGFLNMIAPALIENAGLLVGLPATIMSEKLVAPIFHMHWMIMTLPEGITLLTSDHPMWASERPDHERCLLALPLSPNKLFMATRPENIPLVQSSHPAVIADLSNRSQCMGAQRFVYGRNTLEFAREYMNAGRAK